MLSRLVDAGSRPLRRNSSRRRLSTALPQICLQRTHSPRLEALDPLKRLQQRVLDKIVGVGEIACPLRQATAGPSLQRFQVSGKQPLERLLVAGPRAFDQRRTSTPGQSARVPKDRCGRPTSALGTGGILAARGTPCRSPRSWHAADPSSACDRHCSPRRTVTSSLTGWLPLVHCRGDDVRGPHARRGIDVSSSRDGGQENRRLVALSFRLLNSSLEKRAECAQKCAQHGVHKTRWMLTVQTPLVVAFSVRRRRFLRGLPSSFRDCAFPVSVLLTYTCRRAVRWPRG